MFIRVTFNDNDFTQVLEEFFNQKKYLSALQYCLEKYDTSDEPEILSKYRKLSRDIEDSVFELLNSDNVTDELKNKVVGFLKEGLLYFLKEKYAKDKKIYDYLSDYLKITIQDTLEDKWENGEVIYYLPRRNQYLLM